MAAKLFFYKTDDKVGRRQYPLAAGDNLLMLMDMNSKGLVIDCPQIRGKELEEFTRKFNVLTADELRNSLEIDSASFMSVLNQCVQCVGCRRRVEHLFYQLTSTGYPTVDPLMLKKCPANGVLTITDEKLRTPQALGTLLYRHHEVLNNLLDSKLRNKTRCVLHSLDTFRSKPFSESWREVWSAMKHTCRDELAVIETKELHDVLENYLKKHKFCQGCRTKIEKAYKLLVGETTTKEKGFVAALYANIKKCHPDKHIHVLTNKIDYLDALIRRAEPEVNSTYSKQRERHAKTLEIAQEEVITCVGMIMYERLRNVYVSLREEERACQVLAAVGVHALYRSFDTSVERKQGISNLELLYQEISRAEKAKEHKREQKKLKKKKKKIEKKNMKLSSSSQCECELEADEEEEEEEDDDEDEDEVDEAIYCGECDDVCEEETDVADATEQPDHLQADNTTDSESCENANNNNHSHVSAEEAESNTNAKGQKTKTKKQKNQKRKQKKSSTPTPIQKKNRKKTQQQPSNSKQLRNSSSCSENLDDNNNLSTTNVREDESKEAATSNDGKCNDCLAPSNICPCDSDVKDSGYGSEPNCREASRMSSETSSHEGSVVSCSEGCCNHDSADGHEHDSDEAEHLYNEESDNYESLGTLLCGGPHMPTFSLQQMLNQLDDEDEENCYIPQEVVMEYQCHHEWVQQQRMELRETLRRNFARLCMQRSMKPQLQLVR